MSWKQWELSPLVALLQGAQRARAVLWFCVCAELLLLCSQLMRDLTLNSGLSAWSQCSNSILNHWSTAPFSEQQPGKCFLLAGPGRAVCAYWDHLSLLLISEFKEPAFLCRGACTECVLGFFFWQLLLPVWLYLWNVLCAVVICGYGCACRQVMQNWKGGTDLSLKAAQFGDCHALREMPHVQNAMN